MQTRIILIAMRSKMIFCLGACLLPLSLVAQSFAPIGAKWYYDWPFFVAPNFNFTYFTVTSVGDTLIEGQSCRILQKEWLQDGVTLVDEGREYVFDSAGVVYFYWEGSFDTLYDFGASIGDTIRYKPDTTCSPFEGFIRPIVIDSLGTALVDDTTIAYQIIRDLPILGTSDSFPQPDPPFFDNRIYEGIGSGNYLFPFNFCSLSSIIDIPRPSQLRCYQTPEGRQIKFTDRDCDEVVLSQLDEWTSVAWRVYPNPAYEGQARLQFELPFTGEVVVMDLQGRRVGHLKITNQTDVTLSVATLPKGALLILLQAEDGKMSGRKLLINN